MENLDQQTLHFSQENLWVLNFCLAVIMFGIALELTVADFKRLLTRPRAITVGLLAQVVLLPLVTYLIVLLIQPTQSIALGMILVASCPSGTLSNLLSVLAGGNGALSVSLTALTTLVSFITLPLNFSLWSGVYLRGQTTLQAVEIPVFQILTTLVFIVLIPLLLGMTWASWRPGITKAILKPIRVISVIIFLVFIVVALGNNFDNFYRYIHLLFMIVLIHNAAAYSLGYAVATGLGLNYKDRRTISLDTGIQNSGLALILIFNFFDGRGGMAFLAGWWGIWDMISGLLLAWGMSRWRILNTNT
ncbi:bile acid:sodium symporter family protein [Tunicatimonas pelagia]|uniref:bile acid:sodium symporter family protein n=1 Tax=Tunicatimonas pelagia TaxID=931531 RepID=UPI0026650D3A|nr:bile acid:sodium symporter family protein [Tunicatimonas pelagia]WKN46459.1 bile acid:sodium symporter family protein [Tunicatimonas pelagia]